MQKSGKVGSGVLSLPPLIAPEIKKFLFKSIRPCLARDGKGVFLRSPSIFAKQRPAISKFYSALHNYALIRIKNSMAISFRIESQAKRES